MKLSHKFLVVFLVFALIFSCLFSVITAKEMNSVKQVSNKAILQISAYVKEKYPEITERELVEIFNGRVDTEEVEKLLRDYGIDSQEDWIFIENHYTAKKIILINGVVCAVICVALWGVFFVYSLIQKKKIAEITNYVEQINRKVYDLNIQENSEDEMSLLKNEIYKTTVMLKEQTESTLTDKQNLKNSLSDISHQLKTPLTSITVMVDSILENPDMPQEMQRDFLKDIRRCVNNTNFLVKSLLTLSKIDAESVVFKNRNEKLGEIIDHSIRNTAVLAELKGVEVTGFVQENLTLNCDFKWLCEAVTNIVKNSIEHTQTGGKVEVLAEKQKLFTKITITDNGTGISQKDLPHIFKRFYKGKSSPEDSVGIGLALSKAIIEKSGGIITVTSTEGKGTEFTIKFFK